MAYTHWFTYGENLHDALSTVETKALEEVIASFQKDLRVKRCALRTEWLWDNLKSCTIEVEAENGTTASVFGHKMEMHSVQTIFGEKGFALETRFFDGDTAESTISIENNKVSVFDNGTIEFSVCGVKHYVFIPDWKERMNTTLLAGW